MEESSKKFLVFPYCVTGHGYGHATRFVEIVRDLILPGHCVHVVAGAPDYDFTTAIQSLKLFICKVLLDSRAVRADALTFDSLASLEELVPVDIILAAEINWLKSINTVLVGVLMFNDAHASNGRIRTILPLVLLA